MRASQAAPQVLGHQVRVFGRDQVREPAIDEVDAVDADETGELAVGVENDVAMHEHRFVDALAELGEQFGPGLLAARGARHAQQQLVDRDAERLRVELGFLGVDVDALRQTLARQRALHAQGQLRDRPQIAPLKQEQHEQQRRHECEQHTDQPKNRHPQPDPVVISALICAGHPMPASSLAEQGKRPLNINHKDMRCDDCDPR